MVVYTPSAVNTPASPALARVADFVRARSGSTTDAAMAASLVLRALGWLATGVGGFGALLLMWAAWESAWSETFTGGRVFEPMMLLIGAFFAGLALLAGVLATAVLVGFGRLLELAAQERR